MPPSGYHIGTATSAVSGRSCWEPREELLSPCLFCRALGKAVSLKEQRAAAAAGTIQAWNDRYQGDLPRTAAPDVVNATEFGTVHWLLHVSGRTSRALLPTLPSRAHAAHRACRPTLDACLLSIRASCLRDPRLGRCSLSNMPPCSQMINLLPIFY